MAADNEQLPLFHSLQVDTFVARLETLIAQHLEKVALLSQQAQPTWENLLHPLEVMQNELERFWSPLSHLHAVADEPKLRTCYETCLPKLSAYESALGQNQALFAAVKKIDTVSLNAPQQKIIADKLRDFELSGVALADAEKERYKSHHHAIIPID